MAALNAMGSAAGPIGQAVSQNQLAQAFAAQVDLGKLTPEEIGELLANLTPEQTQLLLLGSQGSFPDSGTSEGSASKQGRT